MGADPHVLLGIFEDREHVVVRNRRGRSHRDEPPVVEPHQAAPIGPDPHVAVAVFPEHADVRFVDHLGRGERISAHAGIEPAEAGDRADPHDTIARFSYGADAVVGETLGRTVVLDVFALQDDEADTADQKAPLAVFADGVHADSRHAVAAVDAAQRVPLESK